MREFRAIALASAVALAASLSGQGKTDATLDKLAAEFAKAFNAKDAAKVASFYAEDAVLMPPNQPIVRGRSNIEEFYKREFQATGTLMLKPMESVVLGSQAFEAGTSTVTTGSAGVVGGGVVTAGPSSENGKYVVIYKRVGSDWKVAYDIFNSDQPPPPVKK